MYPPTNVYYSTPKRANVVLGNYLLKGVIIFIFTVFHFWKEGIL